MFTAIRYFDYVVVCPLLVLDLLWNLESPYKWCPQQRHTQLQSACDERRLEAMGWGWICQRQHQGS